MPLVDERTVTTSSFPCHGTVTTWGNLRCTFDISLFMPQNITQRRVQCFNPIVPQFCIYSTRVCKQWKKEVERIIKNREQLGWVSYNYDTAPDGGHDEHELGHFGQNLDECIQVYIPRVEGTHILRYTGMCCSNGLVFLKKSLNMGPIFC